MKDKVEEDLLQAGFEFSFSFGARQTPYLLT